MLRLAPGRFDLFASSHQIWHLFVFLAAATQLARADAEAKEAEVARASERAWEALTLALDKRKMEGNTLGQIGAHGIAACAGP